MGLRLCEVSDAARNYPQVVAYLEQEGESLSIEELRQVEGGVRVDENNPAAWTSGIVTEVQQLQVLEYTWNQGPYMGGPALQAKIRYELEPEAEGSALTVTHVLYDTTGDKYVVTFPANWHFHLYALNQVLNGEYQDFADYVERQAEESGLSRREFMLKQVIGLHEAYGKKVSGKHSVILLILQYKGGAIEDFISCVNIFFISLYRNFNILTGTTGWSVNTPARHATRLVGEYTCSPCNQAGR